MELWRLSLALLLPLSVCCDAEVTLVKTVGKDPDVTPLCTNETQTPIDMIVCRIRTERMGGEECRLLYRHGHGFINECGSKFRLVTINQTVFVYMSSLTATDGGSHSCECVNQLGTFTYHLNITVEEEENTVSTRGATFSIPVVVALPVITAAALIVGILYKRKTRRPETSGLSEQEPPSSLKEDDSEDPYTGLQHPTHDVYQTI